METVVTLFAPQFKRLLDDKRGTTAVAFSLLATPLFALTGLSVDYARAIQTQTKLQQIVDASAIAGARLPATSNANRQNAAVQMFNASIADAGLGTVTSDISSSNAEVVVKASVSQDTLVMGLFGKSQMTIGAKAGARSQIENGGVVCLLALNPSTDDGLHLQGITKTASKNCWAWVNSDSSQSINAVGAATGTAQGFCTVGGVVGAEHFAPTPYTGCEAMDDPFKSKFDNSYPAAFWCNSTNLQLKSGTHTLYPGVYCGGIELKPQADVTFMPGTYVLKDGPLVVAAGSTAKGDGVTMFFRGDDTYLEVRGGGSIEMKAPDSGTYAGFLFVDRMGAFDTQIRETTIQGGGSIKMEGVLYAPQWKVNISGNSEINKSSKYFAMIADSFYLEGNGKLYINPDAADAGLPDLMPKIKNGPVLTQ